MPDIWTYQAGITRLVRLLLGGGVAPVSIVRVITFCRKS